MTDTHGVKVTCEATSSKTGERCTAYPAKGGKLCAGHAHMGVSANPQANGSRGAVGKALASREKAAQREKDLERAKLGVRERIALELAERADEVARVLVADAITKGDAQTLRIALDQALGRPVERVETSTATPDVSQLTDAQRDELRSWAMSRIHGLRDASVTHAA